MSDEVLVSEHPAVTSDRNMIQHERFTMRPLEDDSDRAYYRVNEEYRKSH